MKSHLHFFILFSLLVWAPLGFSQTNTTFKYEGYLENSGSPVTATGQTFTVSLRKPSCGSALGLSTWSSGATVNITNGFFSISPTWPAGLFAAAMDPNNAFGCTVGEARNLEIQWGSETFTIALQDAPRANFSNYAKNADAIGGTNVMSAMACANNQVLKFVSANNRLECLSLTATDIPALTAGHVPSLSGDVTGTISATSVEAIRGTTISATAPTTNQVLKFNGTQWTPAADDTGASSDATYASKGIVQINTDSATSGLLISAGILSLPNVISASSVGSGSLVPVITYDQKGRITAAATMAVDDTSKLPLAGGTLTGNLNMNTNSLLNAVNVSATNLTGRNVFINDNDTNYITLRAPTNVASDFTLQLPLDTGAAGQVLTTDGTGILTWTSAGGGGTVTSVNSANSLISISTPTTAPVLTLNTTAAGGVWVDGGNSFPATATIGTNNSQQLNIETNNTTRMSVTNTGDVGIGTTTPAEKLEVQGNIFAWGPGMIYGEQFQGAFAGGSEGSPVFTYQGDTTTGIFFPTTSTMSFSTGGSERARLNATGNWGFGNTSPSSRLDVSGAVTMRSMAAPGLSSATQGRIYFDSTLNRFRVSENAGSYIDLTGPPTGFTPNYAIVANGTGTATSLTCAIGQGLGFDASGFATCTNFAGSNALITGGNTFGAPTTLGTNDAFSLGFETSGTTRMTIDTSGNVGIGTSSPSNKLTVFGDTRISDVSGTHNVVIGAQAGSASTFRFPANNGSDGLVLSTDGTGNTSWKDVDEGNSFTVQIQLNGGNETLVGIGATPSSGGTTNLGYSNSGRPALEYYSLTTNSVVGAATTNQIHTSWITKTDFHWTPTAGAPTSNVRYWIGYAAAAPAYGVSSIAPNGSDTYTGLNLMGFRYSSAAGDTSFACITCNVGVCTNNSSGTPLTASTKYKMKIVKSGSQAQFYINDSLVCSHSTNLPSAISLVPSITSQTLDGTGKHIRFHRIRMQAVD